MQQLYLFESAAVEKEIELSSVKAVFTEVAQEQYDVMLDVSSNKFFIKIHELAGKIEAFEIVAVKSFISLTKKTVSLLRRLVEHLFCRVDL